MKKKIMMLTIVGLVLFMASLVQADYTTNLVSRWAFNPGSELVDDWGDNSALTQGSGVTISGGQAVFDGTSGAELNAGTGASDELNVTPDITAWLRINLSDQRGNYHQFLFDHWGPEWVQRPWQMFVRSDNGIFQGKGNYEGWDGTSVVRTQAGSTVGVYNQYDTMVEIAYTWNSDVGDGTSRMSTWINGVEFGYTTESDQSPASNGLWPDTLADVIMGTFNGTLEEARIYNAALTAEQLAQIEYVAVPEPLTLTLLSLGIPLLVSRRRRN